MHGVLGAVYNVAVGETAEDRSGRASMATMPKSALQHGVVRCRNKREERCREDDGVDRGGARWAAIWWNWRQMKVD